MWLFTKNIDPTIAPDEIAVSRAGLDELRATLAAVREGDLREGSLQPAVTGPLRGIYDDIHACRERLNNLFIEVTIALSRVVNFAAGGSYLPSRLPPGPLVRC